MVESELIQHVFEILDSDWLCDEVTSNTTSGATSEVFKSRVDAAKDLGRIRSYSDEREDFCQLLQQITHIQY